MKVRDMKRLNKESLLHCGFQATNLGKAIDIVERMKKDNATVFLTFTSNMVASGLRGVIAELCRNDFVDLIITAGGSLDHDLIRSSKDYAIGSFMMDDAQLHREGLNRIGNIIVPNECYEYLEGFMKEVFSDLYSDEKSVSPSRIAAAIGEKTGKDSFLHWCSKNEIPVFCPGITDSAIGLQAHFFKQQHKDFAIDVTKDMQALSQISLNAEKTGGIILGGGISKHHAIGVNLLRGGFDYAIYVTTASPWDGSLSGARTNEGVSWGKIREEARHVTVDCDATIALPLIVSGFPGD